jgi:hypothetical protein
VLVTPQLIANSKSQIPIYKYQINSNDQNSKSQTCPIYDSEETTIIGKLRCATFGTQLD